MNQIKNSNLNLSKQVKITKSERFRTLEHVTVKNAKVVFDSDTRIYYLVHYDTIIAQIKELDYPNYEILSVLKCSNTSTKAIYQLAYVLHIDTDLIKQKMKPYSNYGKYEHGTTYRMGKSDYIDIVKNYLEVLA